MKIVRITVFGLTLPLQRPYELTSSGSSTWRSGCRQVVP